MYTLRQIKVILLISEGMSNKEIASELGIEEGSVSNHRKRILKQSTCRNWNQLMALLGRTGFLDQWQKTFSLRQNIGNGDETLNV